MLTKSKKITIEGRSVIDGVQVAGFVASIDSTDPSQMTLSSYQIDKVAYKANRVTARADEAAFEDYAYEVQDAMIAEMSTATEPAVEPVPAAE